MELLSQISQPLYIVQRDDFEPGTDRWFLKFALVCFIFQWSRPAYPVG